MPKVTINTQYPAQSQEIDGVKATYSGHLFNLKAIIDCLETHQQLNDSLYPLILKNRKDFSLILESESYVFAMVDRIKSHSLYYTHDSTARLVSNCANTLFAAISKPHLSQQSLVEFIMAGYVIGRDTLYNEIKQLQAGELLFWHRDTTKPTIHRYYRYLPDPYQSTDRDILLDQLDKIFNAVIDDLIGQAAGRAIYIPLSGGLDSRFILAKLVEKGYDNITAFTYGINGNHEMQHAEKVTRTLAVRWLKLPSNPEDATKLFNSNKRQQYERYAHALTTIPFYGEFEVLNHLVEHHLIPNDAIIVNGQSGDYITGGHVRAPILNDDASHDDIFDYIINKHFSLWLPAKMPENIDQIKTRLQIQYDKLQHEISGKALNFSHFYEYWEWQERQCKNVIRGQRLYEFFGFSWNLPFWHADLMDFYLRVPYSLKHQQRLYIDYLQRYNYKDLFSTLRRKVQPWVLRYRWIPLVAKLVHLTSGRDAQQIYYRRKDYYSTYHHQYALYGKDYFLKHYKDLRNPESLVMRELLERCYHP